MKVVLFGEKLPNLSSFDSSLKARARFIMGPGLVEEETELDDRWRFNREDFSLEEDLSWSRMSVCGLIIGCVSVWDGGISTWVDGKRL